MYFKFILFRVYKIWLSIKKKDQWLTIFTQHIEDNIIIHQNQHFVSSSKRFFFSNDLYEWMYDTIPSGVSIWFFFSLIQKTRFLICILTSTLKTELFDGE